MARIELKIGCVDVSEKLELRDMVVHETKVVTGGVSARDAQGEMGGGGDAMERSAGLGRIWAVGAACC